jgi:hypothetical protein
VISRLGEPPSIGDYPFQQLAIEVEPYGCYVWKSLYHKYFGKFTPLGTPVSTLIRRDKDTAAPKDGWSQDTGGPDVSAV